MIKKIIAISFLFVIIFVGCLENNKKNEGENEQQPEVTQTQDNFDDAKTFYFDIKDQYNTEEIEYDENRETDIILPGEYEPEKGEYNEEKVNENYDKELEEFNFNIYKGIINDLNNILASNTKRISIINNLENYEVTTFEILYAMHNVLYELNDDKKQIIMKKMSEDPVLIEFFKRAPNYAESTIIAEIFQTLSFINMNVSIPSEEE